MSKARIFDVLIRRRLGITKEAVEAALTIKKRAGEFDGWTKDNLQENLEAKGQQISLECCEVIKNDPANTQAWCDAQACESQLEGPAAPRKVDWEALLAFVSKLIEMLMPFIIKA